MKRLNITRKQYSESKYLQKKYGKLAYVSESGKLFKTTKGQVLKFAESRLFSGEGLISAEKLAKWMKECATEMFEGDESGCYTTFIGDDNRNLALAIGWAGGYDEDTDTDDFYSKSNPEYRVNAAIVIYNPYDCADFEYLDMPYYRNDGEAWDTAVTLGSSTDWLRSAKSFIEEYKAIMKSKDVVKTLHDDEDEEEDYDE